MTKAELRQTYFTRQKALSPAERAEKSRRIARNFFESIDLSKTKLLHCFIPIAKFNEIDTTIIIQAVWKSSAIRIAVPRVNFETGGIESFVYTAETELIENRWGIREPVGGDLVEPAAIDLVLVPGLAFDMAGHRVGYGKGFYDLFLKQCREDCVKIGLSYFEPVDKISDTREGDIEINLCVTPEGIFNAETRRKNFAAD